jgi:hypothetical protein
VEKNFTPIHDIYMTPIYLNLIFLNSENDGEMLVMWCSLSAVSHQRIFYDDVDFEPAALWLLHSTKHKLFHTNEINQLHNLCTYPLNLLSD